ncbi:Small conductance calcium-activated potassium channel protein [Lucilia cuprina]|uniref:Small conductance calcium-activated potassium channel protein n=1 Tax=Lucilia cuprina TaxID=7375 RepID=A0A0L0BU81_LUCCU|nr:Small conductance calcium-activated potassium channel protein [Lucilia cuprina]
MSMQKLTDATTTTNSGYVSSEETDSLLVSNTPKCKTSVLRQIKMNSANGPTTNNMTSTASTKPTLMRQDRTSTYLTSPQLSQQTRLGSDESERSAHVADDDVEQGLRPSTVPDIEVYQEDQSDHNQNQKQTTTQHHNQQQKQQQLTATSTPASASQGHQLQQQPTISITNLNHGYEDNSNLGTSYQNLSSSPISPSAQTRCRACRNCSRRASTTPISTTGQMDRSTSRDSVKSAFQQGNLGSSLVPYGSNNALPLNVPPVLVTSSPTNGSRIIRQSSQPESSNLAICCGAHTSCGHSHTVPNVSLRQLRTEPSQSDGIAGIAADSLRINGGMRPFKQFYP